MNMNSNNSGFTMQTLNNSTTHNTVMIKKENHTMDLKRLGASKIKKF